MTRVKGFWSSDIKSLEKQINKFIENEGVEAVSISHSVSNAGGARLGPGAWSAFLVYRRRES